MNRFLMALFTVAVLALIASDVEACGRGGCGGRRGGGLGLFRGWDGQSQRQGGRLRDQLFGPRQEQKKDVKEAPKSSPKKSSEPELLAPPKLIGLEP